MDVHVHRRRGERGQATIMLTLSLLAMFGLMGLAVDLGWAFYVRRSAQAAADVAALSTTRAGIQSNLSIDCISMGCAPTPISCTQASAPTLTVGCSYAQRNGFSPGGHSGHQTVTIQANTGNPVTANGVTATYWVTMRVTETVPQLFSAVLGHPLATVAARATGAVTNITVRGSLVLLNRSGDASPTVGSGTNLVVGGGGTVTATAGILMASNAVNSGKLGGSSRVTNTAFTRIFGSGGYSLGGAGSVWQNAPTNGYADGAQFMDPMSGKGQPPLTTQVQPAVAVAGGTIAGGTTTAPTLLHPGNYYATSTCGTGCVQASGAAITLGSGYFKFDNGGSGFGDYIFYGGVSTGSGNTTVTFAPGRYVFAGTNGSNSSLSISNGTSLKDNTAAGGVPASDAGEVFIFTDLSYPGLSTQIPAAVQAHASLFSYGSAGIKTGSNSNSSINLHGLNPSSPSLPSDLQTFAPLMMWQDQGNSHIKYTDTGHIDTSCAGGTIDSPCSNPKVPATATSPQLNISASPNIQLYGAVYQPRGAWTVLQGSGTSNVPVQIVTGAMSVQGSGSVLLQGVANPITRLAAALVE
ncbi:MAG: TadE/TadG family type IV pilus assembly protein [Bryobacteraceae bacterium]